MAKKRTLKSTTESTNNEVCIACTYIIENLDENFEARPVQSYGLCGSHYQTAAKAVSKQVEAGMSKNDAWNVLIKAGKAKATTRHSSQDWFLEAFE